MACARHPDPAAEMTSGLMTDKQLHPLNEAGVAPYTNLYAAGAVLGDMTTPVRVDSVSRS